MYPLTAGYISYLESSGILLRSDINLIDHRSVRSSLYEIGGELSAKASLSHHAHGAVNIIS